VQQQGAPVKEAVKPAVGMQQKGEQAPAAAVPDCVENADCFRNYLLECKPAIAKDEGQTVTRIFEIKKQKEQFYCDVHRTTVGLNVKEEDCVAYNKQTLSEGADYSNNRRVMKYFKVDHCV